MSLPLRPLPEPRWWHWAPRIEGEAWPWARVYHRDQFCPDGVFHRRFGPMHRFDHLTGEYTRPAICAAGRAVLYVGSSLEVSLAEAFRERPVVDICPNFRVALVEPVVELTLIDVGSPEACERIGAPTDLGPGKLNRTFTQAWARAMWEDCRLASGRHADGVYYRARFGKGPALALWDTQQRVRTVVGGTGATQDFSLQEMWARVVVGLERIGKPARRVTECTCYAVPPER